VKPRSDSSDYQSSHSSPSWSSPRSTRSDSHISSYTHPYSYSKSYSSASDSFSRSGSASPSTSTQMDDYTTTSAASPNSDSSVSRSSHSSDGSPRLSADSVVAESVVDSTESIREQIVRIYEKHNPRKLTDVDALLAEWAGEERQLLMNIRKKYLQTAIDGLQAIRAFGGSLLAPGTASPHKETTSSMNATWPRATRRRLKRNRSPPGPKATFRVTKSRDGMELSPLGRSSPRRPPQGSRTQRRLDMRYALAELESQVDKVEPGSSAAVAASLPGSDHCPSQGTESVAPSDMGPRAVALRDLVLQCPDGIMHEVAAGTVLILTQVHPAVYWTFGFPEDDGPGFTGRFVRALVRRNQPVIRVQGEHHWFGSAFSGLCIPQLLKEIKLFGRGTLGNAQNLRASGPEELLHEPSAWPVDEDSRSEPMQSGQQPDTALYCASHILLKYDGSVRPFSWKDPDGVEISKRSREDAEAILVEIRDALGHLVGSERVERFAELAYDVSDCGSAREGGNLGQLHPAEMDDFEDVLMGLAPGDISDVVHTQSGLHIIMRTDIIVPSTKYRMLHILVKHQGSARQSSWRDPAGGYISQRTESTAEAGLRKLLEEVQLVTGEDRAKLFSELAGALSDCGSAREGGDLGELQLGDTDDEVEDAVLHLPVWGLSDVVKTESGCHIILRTPVDYAAVLLSTSEAKVSYASFWKRQESLVEARAGEDSTEQLLAAHTIDTILESILGPQVAAIQEFASEVADQILNELMETADSADLPRSPSASSVGSTVVSSQTDSTPSSPVLSDSDGNVDIQQGEKLMGDVALLLVDQVQKELQHVRPGTPVDKSIEAVVAKNRKRAEAGHAWAQARLGMRLIKGEGVEVDVEEGELWLQRSIENGCKAAVDFKKTHDYKKSLAQAAGVSMAPRQATRERSVAMKAALNFRSLRRGARANFEADLSKGFEQELDTSIRAMSQGMYEDALRPLKRCWKLRPNDAVVAYNLATCYALSGDMDSAFNWLALAIKAGMDSAQLAEDPDYKLLFPGRRFAPLWIRARSNLLDRQQSLNEESYGNVLRGRGRLPAVVGAAHEDVSAETRTVRRQWRRTGLAVMAARRVELEPEPEPEPEVELEVEVEVELELELESQPEQEQEQEQEPEWEPEVEVPVAEPCLQADPDPPTEMQVAARAMYSALRDVETSQLVGAYERHRNYQPRPVTELDPDALASICSIVSSGLQARAAMVLDGSHSLPSLPSMGVDSPMASGTEHLPPVWSHRRGSRASTSSQWRPHNPADWSNNDVCGWLEEDLGLGAEQVKLCTQHGVGGAALLVAPIEEICDTLAIHALGARKRLRSSLHHLRQRNLANCHVPLPALSSSLPAALRPQSTPLHLGEGVA
jgi:NIMA-interacting peptidyl-prolyl cis-trans isomerase 1